MKKIIIPVAVLLILISAIGIMGWKRSLPIFSVAFDSEEFEKLKIAPFSKAVTFAMATEGEVLLVLGATSKDVSAININQRLGENYRDGVEAFLDIGREQLQRLATNSPIITYSWEQLGVPFISGSKHVAVGTNYSAHAEEVGHEGEPFLFPKLSTPTAWHAPVNKAPRLDHEIELCALTLAEYSGGNPPQLGYVLCGDFTDRWLLVKHIKLGGEMGFTGFPEGKGGESRLPVGPLLVIPTEADFYNEIDLNLYVNNQLRQRSRANKMIWSPEKILAKALEICGTPYQLYDKEINLLDDCKKVPERTLILTGTPEGVMFNILSMWNPSFYLNSGDAVKSFGTYLGYMNNPVQ